MSFLPFFKSKSTLLVTDYQKWLYLAFTYCHRNSVRIPLLNEILEQVKAHLTFNPQAHFLTVFGQLPRVMYMLGERNADVESALRSEGDNFQSLQFGALYYEQTSQPVLALECCEKALGLEKESFRRIAVYRCMQRLRTRHRQ